MKKITLEWSRTNIGVIAVEWAERPLAIVAGGGPGCGFLWILRSIWLERYKLPHEKPASTDCTVPCTVENVEILDGGRIGSVELQLKKGAKLLEDYEFYPVDAWRIRAKDASWIVARDVTGIKAFLA